MVLAKNLPQLPGWPLIRRLEPRGCFPDGVFSLCLICATAKVDFRRITASAVETWVVRGQKSRLLLLPRLSIICKLAWGTISQNKRPQTEGKKIYCHLGIPSVTCEEKHLWCARVSAWWWDYYVVNIQRLLLLLVYTHTVQPVGVGEEQHCKSIHTQVGLPFGFILRRDWVVSSPSSSFRADWFTCLKLNSSIPYTNIKLSLCYALIIYLHMLIVL